MSLRTRAVLLAIGLGLALPAASQSVTSTPEVFAKDMREEIVHIDVTVKDMFGRQETRPMPITIFRPPGDGPFPLVDHPQWRRVL